MAEHLIRQAEWQALTARHPVLASLPLEVRAVAGLRCYAAGETLFRRGTRPRAMLYVIDGEIRLVRHTAGGGQVVLQRGRQGFVAEASLDAPAYHCDVVAAEAGCLVAFPMPVFRQALDDHPGFRSSWMSALAREVRRLRAQNERLHLRKAADRVLHYLETEGHDGVVTLTQSLKAWAAELGLSHEALYRALAALERDGHIERGEQRLRIAAGPAAARVPPRGRRAK